MRYSFVIPCYRSQETIARVVDEIADVMSGCQYEVVLVNDNSPDRTWSVIQNLCSKDPHIKAINMAKNFGQHAALMAGYRVADGDFIISLDDDGQTPADEVWNLIDKINEGYDVVYASYEYKQHNRLRNWGSRLNALMTEWLLDKSKDLQVTSYFIMRRFVCDEIIRYEYAYPYVIGLILRSTSNIGNVPVHHRARTIGTSGYSLLKLVSLWLNGFTAFSVKPLRLATMLGAVFAAIGVIMAVVTIVKKIIDPTIVVGWSSLFSATMLIGGAILAVLGMIGEYIGRIYISINNAPQYVVRETINIGSAGGPNE